MKQRLFLLFIVFFSVGIHLSRAQIIAPATHLCVGAIMTLSDATPSGKWSSSNTTVATIGSSSGVVTGIAAGTATISYTVGLASSTITITVNPLPTFLARTQYCVFDRFVMIDTLDSGSVWTSSNTAVIVFDSAITFPGISIGFFTADTIGTTIISFTNAAGCTASITATVSPTRPSITGPDSLCLGTTITLSDSVGGKWYTQDPTVANVDSLTGVVHGLSVGMTTILFQDSAYGCYVFSSVNVQSAPVSPTINELGIACVGDSMLLYAGGDTGTWNSNNTLVATVSGSGMVTFTAIGAAIITFSMTNNCGTSDTTIPLAVANCNVGVNQVTKQAAMEVSPNPCSGKFTFSLSSDVKEAVEVTVSNLVGQRISQLRASTNEPVDVSLNAAPGVYLLSAKTARGVYYNTRVIVQ